MDKHSKILISGAGIAGLTAAISLGRRGFLVHVIEKSPSIRADGFIISLSHASYDYAKKLGVLEKITARNTGNRESSYHDRTGRAMLTLDYKDLFAGVDVVQIMRDDLQDILYAEAKDLVEFRLETSVAAIDANGDRSQVRFSDGREDDYDVVMGADGLHSNTRTLVFRPRAVRQRYLGLFSSAYRLPNVLGLHQRFENHMERDRYMCVYTTREDSLACVFIWQSDAESAPRPEKRYEALRRFYAGAPSLVQTVLGSYPQGETVYMDPLIQIEMREWHRGNVVLLGDAAHCITLLSGQGASSAFWGACVLSDALAQESKADAFRIYEETLQPVMRKLQPATRRAAHWYVPRSKPRYLTRDAAMRYLPDRVFQQYFKSKYSRA